MPKLKTYDLFISHAWAYNSEYYRLIKLLDAATNFKYRNYSVPEHDPVIDPNTIVGRTKLTKLLDQQIKPVNIVLIISGMYVNHKYWLQKEIELATNYNKPIIGVLPQGQERSPTLIQNTATMVRWNTESIVAAIRQIAL